MKLALLAVVACCVVVVATGPADRRERAPAAAEGAPTSGPRAPAAVHPRPPSRYRVPRHAIRVASARALHTALKRRRPTAIVLANGRYESRKPFLNAHGHRVYAAALGRAVLRAGLSLGGNRGRGGALVRGIVVDVGDDRRTVDGAAIAVWGTGRGRASSTPPSAAGARSAPASRRAGRKGS